ncbi:hypothetical protein STXM2123_27 [Streptomyces sp. F-3]|nr:hypothetical protein STXM2123_27 [Streptomyces sp. F-3]
MGPSPQVRGAVSSTPKAGDSVGAIPAGAGSRRRRAPGG